MKFEQLNHEIKKRPKNDAVRRNLSAVKIALEKKKKIIYLPEKNFETMVEAVDILIDSCNMSIYFIPIENWNRVGKVIL